MFCLPISNFSNSRFSFCFFDLSLRDSLHSCRSFSNSLSLSVSYSRIFAGSSGCPSSTLFKEAVELLIESQPALFQFCCDVESMTNYWLVSQGASNMSRSQAPCDEILFSVLLFCKIIPSQKSVTLTHKNKLFAWGGCKNAQVVQKRALEWILGLFPFIHTASPLQLHKVLLAGDLYSSLHLWSDLWPVFCTCHLKLADTNKVSVIVCLPELSQSGEKTWWKNKRKKQELLPGRTVLPKCVIEGYMYKCKFFSS